MRGLSVRIHSIGGDYGLRFPDQGICGASPLAEAFFPWYSVKSLDQYKVKVIYLNY